MRSRTVSAIRRWLNERGFVEVETPVLHPIAGGAHAKPFVTHYNAVHADYYLRIALELYLKRLVVGGFEKVYEIGRVFRNEGVSPRHNPEFTMLELYQAYADYIDMMELTERLVADVATELCGTSVLAYQGRELDLTPPWRRATLEELIAEQTGVEVSLELGADELRRRRCLARGPRRRLRGSRQGDPRDLREDHRSRRCGARSSSATTRRRCPRSPATTARGRATWSG